MAKWKIIKSTQTVQRLNQKEIDKILGKREEVDAASVAHVVTVE